MIEKSKDDIIYGVNLEDVTFEQWPVKEAEVKWSGIFTQIPQVFRSLFSCAGNKMLTRCVRWKSIYAENAEIWTADCEQRKFTDVVRLGQTPMSIVNSQFLEHLYPKI